MGLFDGTGQRSSPREGEGRLHKVLDAGGEEGIGEMLFELNLKRMSRILTGAASVGERAFPTKVTSNNHGSITR